MNTQEGMDLVKMAVAVVILSLVISAVMSVWYLMSSAENKLRNDLSKTKESAAMDRLYELQDLSRNAEKGQGSYPLVTNVVSTLTEFNETDLLFIYTDIVREKKDEEGVYEYVEGNIFTYEGITLTSVHTNGFLADNIDTHESISPISLATKELLRSSKQRCFLELFETKYNNSVYMGIRITVLESW